jgi:uncharacterized protein YdcH (DUF465 family)
MPVSPRDVREDLMASSQEFQNLAREHSRYEDQLEQLSRQPYLSMEDVERQTALKKLKLRVKDRMEEIIARSLKQPPSR